MGHFLEGLCSISEWSLWNRGEDDEMPPELKLMLRPMVVGDFGRHLAGTLAPLDVDDWREVTVTRDFCHQNAQQVYFWRAYACCMHLKASHIAVGGCLFLCNS